MPLLYFETNLILAVATGRLPGFEEVFAAAPPALRLAVPSICIMEAMTAALREQAAAREFEQRVRARIGQVRESGHLPELVRMRARLEESLVLADQSLRLVRARLTAAVDAAVRRAELLPLDAPAAAAGMSDVVCEQPTDNLILHAILRHAAADADPAKAFVTRNMPDFTDNGGRDRLRVAGVVALLSTPEALAGWLASAGHSP